MIDAENFLQHYASQYYDPVKAREYYLRTRELKGRQSTSNLKTDKKKEAWAYAKTQIKDAEKQANQNAAEAQKELILQLKENARIRQAEVREELDKIISQLASKSKNARSKAEREKAKQEIESIRDELKTALEGAREAYAKLKDDLKAKYETERQNEYDAIRTKV